MSDLDRESDDLRAFADADADDLIAGVEADDSIAANADGQIEVSYSPTRDGQGRFASQGEQNVGEKAGEAENPPAGPTTFREMKEFLDEAERRRSAEHERDELRTRLARIEAAKAPKDGPSDDELLFSDPAAFRRRLDDRMQAGLTEQRISMQEMFARQTHGDALTEAQKALVATRDENLAQSFMRSGNPFEAMIAWHRREKTLAAIPDGDLTKYEASVQDRLLKDPAFLARAVDAARGQAAGAPAPQRPGNVHRLPSVSRAGSAATAALPDDMSDEDLLADITARR